MTTAINTNKHQQLHGIARKIRRNWPMYCFLLPAVVLVFIFCYLPMPGIIVAFKEYDIFKGLASPFNGIANFKEIFSIRTFTESIKNTLTISVLSLFLVFPVPLIFALMLNELRGKFFKRFTQTVSYLPYFLSWIAVIGLATSIYSNYGLINDLRVALFGEDTERIMFLSLQDFFVPNVIMLTIWKQMGWDSIIYLSAIAGIDPSLYEAAIIDGANKWQQVTKITIPSIKAQIVILFIMQIGGMFNSNFELIYGLQNPYIDFEVISTVIYKQGILQGEYGLATAFGLMQGVISTVLVLLANRMSKKVNDISII